MNVLIYAFRADTPRHEVAHAWLTSCLEDLAEEVVIPDLIWIGFARITTNPRFFWEPSTVDEVTGFMRAVTAAPTARSIPGLSFGVESLFRLMKEAQARGNLVADAYIAALALEIGAAVATYDRDFRRFDNLRIVTPGE